jgi:hypothetical protein
MNDNKKLGKQNDPPWANVDFGLLSPVIPGALVTLIGIIVVLFGEKVNGTIVCYVGVMALIVAAGQIGMQYFPKQPDLDAAKRPDRDAAKPPHLYAAGRRAQSHNAIFVACCVVGAVITGLAIICVATLTVFKGGTGTGLFAALGSLFFGGFIGFLFSIPNEQQ